MLEASAHIFFNLFTSHCDRLSLWRFANDVCVLPAAGSSYLLFKYVVLYHDVINFVEYYVLIFACLMCEAPLFSSVAPWL